MNGNGIRNVKHETVVTNEVKDTEWVIKNAGSKQLKDLMSGQKKMQDMKGIISSKMVKLNYSMEEMTEIAYISRAAGYKIIKNQMRPQQDVLLRISFALRMTPEETQELLKAGHCPLLTASRERDRVIIYGLSHKLLLEEMDELLLENGLSSLIPESKQEA